MREARCFLVIAEDTERLMLISTTLHRKFPNAVVQTCRDTDAATSMIQTSKLDAVIAHRSTDMDEIPLLEHLRATTAVPIVALSGYHDEEAARAAGASHCLRLDQWLLIGTVVAKLIGARTE